MHVSFVFSLHSVTFVLNILTSFCYFHTHVCPCRLWHAVEGFWLIKKYNYSTQYGHFLRSLLFSSFKLLAYLLRWEGFGYIIKQHEMSFKCFIRTYIQNYIMYNLNENLILSSYLKLNFANQINLHKKVWLMQKQCCLKFLTKQRYLSYVTSHHIACMIHQYDTCHRTQFYYECGDLCSYCISSKF